LEEFPGNRVTYVGGGQEEAGRGHDEKAQADHFHVAGGWFNWWMFGKRTEGFVYIGDSPVPYQLSGDPAAPICTYTFVNEYANDMYGLIKPHHPKSET